MADHRAKHSKGARHSRAAVLALLGLTVGLFVYYNFNSMRETRVDTQLKAHVVVAGGDTGVGGLRPAEWGAEEVGDGQQATTEEPQAGGGAAAAGGGAAAVGGGGASQQAATQQDAAKQQQQTQAQTQTQQQQAQTQTQTHQQTHTQTQQQQQAQQQAQRPKEPFTAILGNPSAWDRSACASGIDQHPASGKTAMLMRPPAAWRRRADPAADEGAKRFAERPGEVARPGQPAMPSARRPTAVLYVHFGRDEDEEANLAAFVAGGVQLEDNVQYRVVLSTPAKLDPTTLPRLPATNARYVQAPQPACNTSVWGAIGSVLQQLELQPFEYVVVASSRAMGPFVPPYVRQHMHWTEAFTRQLDDATKLVGSQISCEGAPERGDASAAWRRGPRVLPHAWATDAAGWAALTAARGVFACYSDPWDVKYHSDAGASAAILAKGWNLASLQARYKGVDWRDERSWGCDARLRPDRPLFLDGANPSPYELLFLPFPETTAERYVDLRTGLKYRDWVTEGTLLPDNMYMGPGVWFSEWSPRVERSLELVAVRGGPQCFDYEAYKKAYPELRALASSCLGPKCGFDLFQHYVVLGQFQGRAHRFACPPARASPAQLARLALARGRACFNHTAYRAAHADLAGLAAPQALFVHWALRGRAEGRAAPWACAESSHGLARGVDSTPAEELERERQRLLAGYAKHGDGLLEQVVKLLEGQGEGAAAAQGAATAQGAQQQRQQQQAQQAGAVGGATAAQQASGAVAAAAQQAADTGASEVRPQAAIGTATTAQQTQQQTQAAGGGAAVSQQAAAASAQQAQVAAVQAQQQ